MRIYIGSNPSGRDARAVAVLKHSILSNTEADVEFVDVGDDSGGTGFSWSRWGIPALEGDTGFAVYLDADMLVYGDVAELYSYRQAGQWVVADTSRGPSAVSVIDCSADYSGEPERTLKPMHEELRLFDAGLMSRGIPEAWNCRNYCREGHTKLMHLTATKLQPWGTAYKPEFARDVDMRWLDYERQMKGD